MNIGGGVIYSLTQIPDRRHSLLQDLLLDDHRTTIPGIKPNVERWVLPGWGFRLSISYLVDPFRIYYIPIFVHDPTTFIRVGIWVEIAAVGNCFPRVYAWNNGVPGALIVALPALPTNVGFALSEAVINLTLQRGFYFLAMRFDADPEVGRTHWVETHTCPVANYWPNPGATMPCMFVDAAYADPAPAPTGCLEEVPLLLLREN